MQRWRARLAVGCLVTVLAGAVSASGAGVVFSEIMYHPVDAVTNIVDGDEYEFIELCNAGAVPVSLLNATFTAGISYTFTNATTLAPGALLVVVRDRAAFTNRYPAVTNLAAGAYTGSLANNGEKVTLKDGLGNTLFSVTYGTSGTWPSWADGDGCSLVLRDPDGDPDVPATWGPSADYNGTPGATGAIASVDLVINEVLSHTDPPLEDALEVFNTTTNAIDMTGWYLSDDAAVRAKYRITNGVVAARGFKVFYEYQFNTNVYFNTNNIPFEFSSSRGDHAYLTAADATGRLTRVVDLVHFEAAENGVSFGRYPNGTGDWVTLSRLTLGTSVTATNPMSDLALFRTGTGASNSLPRVGPVVISEIMYHPANDRDEDEYVELLNPTTNAVPLYDPAYPSNTWRMTTAVSYAFSSNTVIPPNGRLLVVGTTNVPAFRAVYGLATNVPIVGCWTGKLSNSGDSVRLYRPDHPDPGTNFIPYLLVDRVDYSDSVPWPEEPDGHGPSLERVVATNYGNTALNWFPGAIGGSPGAAPGGGFVNAQVSPVWPQPGQAFTVSVFVVSQTVPTQVVCRTVVNGVTNLVALNDGGASGDAVAGDHVYSGTNTAPAVGAWMYYTFQGSGTGGVSFAYPVAQLQPVRAPPLTAGLCGTVASPQATITPADAWTTYEVFDVVNVDNCFSIALNGEGEALIDDVSLTAADGTEYVDNGDFSADLSGSWGLNGNHASSRIDTLADEGSNRVLHVVCSGAMTGWDVVSQTVAVPTGTTATLRFRVRRVRELTPQWLWVKVGTPPADPAISEIMYNSGHEDALTGIDPYEYVEVYNPATSRVSIAGWRLGGCGFDVPAGATIGAGQFVVCCASQQAVATAYAITNVVGDWLATRASLKNSGETVTLYDGYSRPVDTVTYNDKEPWAVAADGYGPSLERISMAASATNSANWGTSGGTTNWIQVAWTGVVGTGSAPFLCFQTNAEGRFWLDSVSVKRVGSGTELVTNGEFEAGASGWVFSGNHARSRVEAGGGGGSNALAVAATYTRWQTNLNGSLAIVVQYGDTASNYVGTAPLALAASSNYVVSFRVRREGPGGCVRAVLGAFSTNIALGVWGTPGRSNSIAGPLMPVGIADVWTDYAICPTGIPNVVRALVDSRLATASVALGYRLVVSNAYEFTDVAYSNVAMRDDGVLPDQAAADGVFAGYIPAQATNRAIVRYHVDVVATNGLRSRRPHADDPSTDYGYWVESGSLQTNLPNWFLFVDGNPIVYPVAARACAVAPNGQVFIDAMARHRGNTYSDTNYAFRTGIALRVNKGHLLDTWFASNQGGINFRHRGNRDSHTLYRRVVNEYLGYELQRTMGMATPRYRHCCLWIDGGPTITLELEDPEDAFLAGNGISGDDFLTQVGYAGRQYIGGDPLLDNFWTAFAAIQTTNGSEKQAAFRTYLAYESVQQCLALLSLTANGDEHFDWNMFQHRTATDRRWRQYPWDVDMSFDIAPSTNFATTNLHIYYSTPLHPGIYEYYDHTSNGFPVTASMFYPETGSGSAYTLPYRFRQQRTVWRDCYTVFTTNYLYPILDALQTRVMPAYQQVAASEAHNVTDEVQNVKAFIASRRNYFLSATWSDKRTNDIWNAAYTPTNVVITELMIDPPVAGQEYVELYNTGTQAVDLGWWTLGVNGETNHIPLGTMLATNAYVILANTMSGTTNSYAELANPATMVQRYHAVSVWDWPLAVWTSATEYATRMVEIPGLTLPNAGAAVELADLTGRLIDRVPYTNAAPWPLTNGVAIEVIDPRADNSTGTAWRACRIVGTPGTVNTAALDIDNDGMDDTWEQRIMAASGGTFTSVWQVLPGDDFDGDGIANGDEFVLGGDPTTNDAALLRLRIQALAAGVKVDFTTKAATGTWYSIYSGRWYDLKRATNSLAAATWTGLNNYTGVVGNGQTVAYTNTALLSNAFYRVEVHLQPLR